MTAVAARPVPTGGAISEVAAPPAPAPAKARDRFLDLVRALALARVVLRHAVQWKWLGYFASMPVMFFVAGSLFAQSLERRPAIEVTYYRARRLLVPYWAFALVALTVLMISVGPQMQAHGDLNVFTILVPLATPRGATSGNLESFTVHLWYLRTYLWMLLIGGVLFRMFRRAPIPTMALSTLGILAYGFGHTLLGWEPPYYSALYDFAAFVPFWVLGYGCHAGWFDRLGVRGCAWLAVAGVAVAAWYIHENPLPDNDPNYSNVALFFLGVPWMFGLFALRRPLGRVANAPGVRGIVSWTSERALTIYLWHLIVIAIVSAVAMRNGLAESSSSEDWLLGLTVVPGTVVFVLALGWLEDVAARRRPVLWPVGKRTPARSPR